LTATPEQLGVNSHFARLRLLDPDRFYDLDAFLAESNEYRKVAAAAESLLDGRPLNAEGASLLDDLLDRHGVGRVRFRNTRKTITGFPERVLHLSPLEDELNFENLAEEFARDIEFASGAEDEGLLADEPEAKAPAKSKNRSRANKQAFSHDPRIDWLAALLRALPHEKILVICSRRSKVIAIEAALHRRIHAKLGVFHEDLSLVQRDRNAAWFADPAGARVLICSEIGGEGRNFQFASHLALFDLPLDPELLEQRIGRLDRIGQTSAIQIHVPYVRGSAQEVLARWHHEGLNGFARHQSGARALLERFGLRVYELCAEFHENPFAKDELEKLVAETAAAREEVSTRLSQGEDRLLDLNSFRPGPAKSLAAAIRREDEDRALDGFMLAVFDRYAIDVEEIAPRTYYLGSAGMLAGAFPGLPSGGFTVTRDRGRALGREDIQFLTWDHPLAIGAIDLLLSSEKGNSSFARWPDKKVSAMYLEAVFVLECVAPPNLHADRFLPPTPLGTLVDQRGKDVSEALDLKSAAVRLQAGDAHDLFEQPALRDELLPRLLERATEIAQSRAPAIIEAARDAMTTQLDHEIHRLRELRKVNPSVRAAEIDLLEAQRRDLDTHLAAARLRLDAIRLIQRGG
jgi:ATP-dependent helicase HepA